MASRIASGSPSQLVINTAISGLGQQALDIQALTEKADAVGDAEVRRQRLHGRHARTFSNQIQLQDWALRPPSARISVAWSFCGSKRATITIRGGVCRGSARRSDATSGIPLCTVTIRSGGAMRASSASRRSNSEHRDEPAGQRTHHALQLSAIHRCPRRRNAGRERPAVHGLNTTGIRETGRPAARGYPPWRSGRRSDRASPP